MEYEYDINPDGCIKADIHDPLLAEAIRLKVIADEARKAFEAAYKRMNDAALQRAVERARKAGDTGMEAKHDDRE